MESTFLLISFMYDLYCLLFLLRYALYRWASEVDLNSWIMGVGDNCIASRINTSLTLAVRLDLRIITEYRH